MTVRKIAMVAASAASLAAAPALADNHSGNVPEEYQTVPAEFETQPGASEAEGVESVTRTRWIRREGGAVDLEKRPHITHHRAGGYAPYPVAFDQQTWLEECYARTRGVERKKRGGIIGGLLGAITGGIIGNRVWDSERLLGTVIGGGLGGVAGAAIGSAIDNGSDEDDYRYDCDAALERYLSGASYPAGRIASRSIPAYAYGYAPVFAYAPVYGYAPQTMTMIETREEIPQRVIVRETVREEFYTEMGSERVIERVPVRQ